MDVTSGPVDRTSSSEAKIALFRSLWRISRVKDPRTAALRAWAEGIARRRGKKIAMVALARRLARMLFAMWRDELAYDPARIRSSRRTLVPASDDGVARPAVRS